MNIVELLNSSKKNDIEKALALLEEGEFDESLLTDIYIRYALNDLDRKPHYKDLKFNKRIEKILCQNGYEKLLEIKLRLKNPHPGMLTFSKKDSTIFRTNG